MALTGTNFAADLSYSSLFPTTNINTNSGSAAFDTSPFVGVLGIAVNGGNGSGALQIYLSSSADTNISNSTNLNITGSNYNGTNAGLQVLNCDTRACKRYLYANWLISGSAANIAADGVVVGVRKYTSNTPGLGQG